MSNYLHGKRVLITGVCGTVGNELLHTILREEEYAPAAVVGIDNNESQLFFLDDRFSDREDVSFFLADVRDKDKFSRQMAGADVVFHAGAFKHVHLCERSPFEAVQTNIHGVQNVIRAAQENEVERVIFTSSDKAVNPTSVMGTSKLMGERLMSAASIARGKRRTIFASTRFGNVLGSRGSVVQVFQKQIERGGPVTLTHEGMTRFVMALEQAVRLVIDSGAQALGGEVFITKMPVIRIQDLAEVMVEELAPRYGHDPKKIEIVKIGTKPGEKLYEELMSVEECRRSMELDDYFVVLPALRELYHDRNYAYEKTISTTVEKPYMSEDEPAMTPEDLREFLLTHEVLAQHRD